MMRGDRRPRVDVPVEAQPAADPVTVETSGKSAAAGADTGHEAAVATGMTDPGVRPEPEAPGTGDAPTADVRTHEQATIVAADAFEPDDSSGADRKLDPVALATARHMARLHLRMGLLVLARAELEALAGRDGLDDAGRADLAEARWRTGDLAGAGATAGLLLERGSGSPTVLAIAAEAVAAEGRPGEARRLAARALDAADGSLSSVFAGMPRHAIWPDGLGDPPMPASVDRPDEARRVADVAGNTGVAGNTTGEQHADRRPTHDTPAAERAPWPGATEACAGGRAALAAGDLGRAALQLSVALRLDPAVAGQVLDVIEDRASEPELALVAVDALRILGREHEAIAAFDVARGGVLDAASPDAASPDAASPDAVSPGGDRADGDGPT